MCQWKQIFKSSFISLHPSAKNYFKYITVSMVDYLDLILVLNTQ